MQKRGRRWGCHAIGRSNKVYQCWNHKPQGCLFIASPNTLCHFVSPESLSKYLCLSLLSIWPSLCLIPSLPPFSASSSGLFFPLSLLFYTPRLPPCHFCLCLALPLFSVFVCLPPQSARADIRIRQTGRSFGRGFTRLRGTGDERRSVRVTIHFTLFLDMPGDILEIVTTRTRGSVLTAVKLHKPKNATVTSLLISFFNCPFHSYMRDWKLSLSSYS